MRKLDCGNVVVKLESRDKMNKKTIVENRLVAFRYPYRDGSIRVGKVVGIMYPVKCKRKTPSRLLLTIKTRDGIKRFYFDGMKPVSRIQELKAKALFLMGLV